MIRRHVGFTLIELMIAVAIIGILSAIAIPAYSKYVQRSRRSDAINAIQLAAAAEEKYYFQNSKYGTNEDLNLFTAANSNLSPEKYYTIALVNTGGDTQTYKITATPTGAQTADNVNCPTLSLDNTGAKLPSPDPNGCWHR